MNIYLIYNPKPYYTVSHSVHLMHNQFNLLTDKEKNKFNIQVFDLVKEYELGIQDKYFFKEYLINKIKNINYDNNYFIFFGRYFLTQKLIYDFSFIEIIKSKGKFILWLDDLQKLFSKKLLKLSKNFDNNKDQIQSIINENQYLDKLDKIISPSIIFFKNLRTNLIDKTLFHFYSIYPGHFKKNNSYSQRINKIILSGYIDSSYRTRSKLLKLYQTKKKYKNNIYYHQHPGYTNIDLTYFETLQKYKYAFIGLVNYPMNYCISKIIETLACGTLALIEYSPLLKEELGLIAFKHYIPIYFDKKDPIDFNKLEQLNKKGYARKIAKEGQKFIMLNFDYRIKILELVLKLRNI